MSILTDHLRLTLLRVLAEAPGYRANSSILHGVAIEFGLATSRDRIKTELEWLREQGLVTTDDLGALVVGQITDRGLDVAQGRAVVPGVQRPAPGA